MKKRDLHNLFMTIKKEKHKRKDKLHSNSQKGEFFEKLDKIMKKQKEGETY